MSNANGLGYAKNVTYYSAFQRLINADGTSGGTGPSLKCSGELSKIINKIGLLTADEVAFAGYIFSSENSLNQSSYLFENAIRNEWFTLTPLDFITRYDGAKYARVVEVEGSYYATLSNGNISNYYGGVRPSVSLLSSVTISGGTGTSEDPYVVN